MRSADTGASPLAAPAALAPAGRGVSNEANLGDGDDGDGDDDGDAVMAAATPVVPAERVGFALDSLPPATPDARVRYAGYARELRAFLEEEAPPEAPLGVAAVGPPSAADEMGWRSRRLAWRDMPGDFLSAAEWTQRATIATAPSRIADDDYGDA